MRLKSIETTPNPNSMKLNLDESTQTTVTYSSKEQAGCPQLVAKLLDIKGIKSIFVCQDFMTVNRDPTADWRLILDAVSTVLPDAQVSEKKADDSHRESRSLKTSGPDNAPVASMPGSSALGEVRVQVQTFRKIPIQVKATDGSGDKRIALSERFKRAAMKIQEGLGADFLKERYWADWGVRYGSVDEVATEVAEEIESTMGEQQIGRLVAIELGETDGVAHRSIESLHSDLSNENWALRLSAVQELGVSAEAVPLLIGALDDSSHQVRRLAAGALGATGSALAVEPLCQSLLNDQSIAVRRTAGDALSDLGDVAAESAMCRALADSNKLVRWRAARFLNELGTEESLPFLQAAANDPHFEVRLEIEAAIERIAGGTAGSLPVWKRIQMNEP
jgi:hypothetical protein